MRFIPIIIAVLMGHLLMAQDEDVQAPVTDGPVYFQGFADVGMSLSTNDPSLSAFRVHSVFGASFNDWFFIGTGPGVRVARGLISFPIFLDMRVGNLTRKRAFFGALGGGLSFGSKSGYESLGPAGHAEIGIRFNNDRKGGFIISCGYELYSAEVVDDVQGNMFWSGYSRIEIVDIYAITVGIGFSF